MMSAPARGNPIEPVLAVANRHLSLGEAREAITKLKRHPQASGHPIAQLLLAQAYGALEKNELGLAACEAAIRLAPNHPEAHYSRGLFLKRVGRREESIAEYDEALRLKPGLTAALFNKGVVLGELGRNQEALEVYDRVILSEPKLAEAHFNRGVVLQLLALDGALEAFDRAISIDGGHTKALFHRAKIHQNAERLKEAAADYERVVAIDPAHADAQSNLIKMLFDRKAYDAALEMVDKAIAADKTNLNFKMMKATCLNHLKRYQEALDAYERILHIDPRQVGAITGRASALCGLRRREEAIAVLDGALALEPDNIDANALRANTLGHLGHFEEEQKILRVLVERHPSKKDLKFNLGFSCLAAGNYSEGLKLYESRELPIPTPDIALDDFAGKSLLVREEQGFGDLIQFGRYLPIVAPKVGKLTFVVRKSIHRLIRSLGTPMELLDSGSELPEADASVSLLSLPLLCGTTLETIPRATPYLFAEPELIERWRAKIGESGFRIGVNWQGNPNYAGEPDRSPPLARFAPVAAIPGARLISVQKMHGLEQLERLPAGMKVETLGEDYLAPEKDSFVDVAAIMQHLDLVITGDTAVAHLAGALGRPVFLALPSIAEWRWLRDRSDSPWYPTMRVFRQKTPGDWASVFQAMAEAIPNLPKA